MVPREACPFAMNPQMLDALALKKRMVAAAVVEAELLAGDLLERERIAYEVARCENAARLSAERGVEAARAAMTPADRRRFRRAEAARNKHLRLYILRNPLTGLNAPAASLRDQNQSP